MSILRKPLQAITVADLEQLVASQARETEELEFKGSLPFKADPKGMPGITRDRWFTHADRIGNLARDELLAELIAFANTGGGTLVLGLHESDDEPRSAERLEPLPKCEALARRLEDACDGNIEPLLPGLLALGVPAGADLDGAGYVVLRVGASAIGPHRLKTNREYYKRRGERCEKMTAREIKDLTLELASRGDRVAKVFMDRQAASEQLFQKALTEAPAGEGEVILIRATAVPTSPVSIPQLTSRQELWWLGSPFRFSVGDSSLDCVYPAVEFSNAGRIGLRELRKEPQGEVDGLHRSLRYDGLAEFSIVCANLDNPNQGRERSHVSATWVIAALVGIMGQVQHLRAKLALDGLEHGVELAVHTSRPSTFGYQETPEWGSHRRVREPGVLTLPRYSLSASTSLDDLASGVLQDLWNAWGTAFDGRVTADWASIFGVSR